MLDSRSIAVALSDRAPHDASEKREGLRTLVVAKVEISEKKYKRWLKVFREAEASVQDREAKVGAAETSSHICVREWTTIAASLDSCYARVFLHCITCGACTNALRYCLTPGFDTC